MDWETLYNEYRTSMIHVAWLYLRDRAAAEDICQEVFVRLLIRHPILRLGQERAYLMIAVANLCRDELGSAHRLRGQSLEDCIDLAGPERSGSDSLVKADLVRAVLALDNDLRTLQFRVQSPGRPGATAGRKHGQLYRPAM